MKENLLNELVAASGISYLSDLHEEHYYGHIYYALERLSPDDYSLEEWEEATGYILGQERIKFINPVSACRFLKDELRKSSAGM